MIPKISINFAISGDGKISTREKSPSGWTSHIDKKRYFEIRANADAIMVGRGTQEADNMSLTSSTAKQPHRIIVSHTGCFDWNSKVFREAGGDIHLIVTDSTVTVTPPSQEITVHKSSLFDALTTLGELGVTNILCEGGGQLVKALSERDLVETIYLTWAGHTLIGGKDAPTITGLPGDFLPASRQYELAHFEPNLETQECYLTYQRLRGDNLEAKS